MKMVRIASAALFLVAASTMAWSADVDNGRKLAKEWCSSCHLATPDQASSGDTAPTFSSIAETAAERKGDLEAWLADPHPPMPNFDLTRYEIDDLLAYIVSLSDQ